MLGAFITKKTILGLLAVCLASVLLFSAPQQAQATGSLPRRFIAIVYDDSGSMRYVNNKDTLKNYIYANYSLQNLVALMDDRDTAKVFLISRRGENPITVKKHKDLYSEFRKVGAVQAGDTFAGTIDEAFKAGASFLKSEKDGEFLFVLVTDGETMYDNGDNVIKGSLKDVFRGYLKHSGLDNYSGRSGALLLSIGSGKLLTPVSDMAAVLEESGVSTQTFMADIANAASAGENIKSAMMELAEAMASTNNMEIVPGKPFTIRYPLQSLVIMEQFQRSSESLITGITGSDGTKLQRSTLTKTKAIDGMKLASTFSLIKSPTGYVKPGTYTLRASGKVKLMAFSKVGFTAGVSIEDGNGKVVAQYKGSRWNTGGILLSPGERLTARVTLAALDGTAVDLGAHVKMSIGPSSSFKCSEDGTGIFGILGSKPGKEYLSINLADPEFFQISLPALAVNVPAAETQQPAAPEPTDSVDATASPVPQPTVEKVPLVGKLLFDWSELDGLSKKPIPVQYTSSAEYRKAAEFILAGRQEGEFEATMETPPPAGIQVRFNGVVFDSGHTSGSVDVKKENTVGIWVNASYAAAESTKLRLRFSSGEILFIGVSPEPRKLKVETSPGSISFGVLQARGGIPACAYGVMIEENGQWRKASPGEMTILVVQPGGYGVSDDRAEGRLSVYPGWPSVFTPVGEHTVTLQAGTGKPGEEAFGSIDVTVNDDWKKWLFTLPEFLFGVLALAYAVMLLLKKRLPMDIDAFESSDAGMADAVKVDLVRNLRRRNFWPFGREVCTLGQLELYPHPLSREKLVLSSECVQHGLRIDGKPPQHHKEKDSAGDYVISGNNVVGIREGGAYKYYRIQINAPVPAKKPATGVVNNK